MPLEFELKLLKIQLKPQAFLNSSSSVLSSLVSINILISACRLRIYSKTALRLFLSFKPLTFALVILIALAELFSVSFYGESMIVAERWQINSCIRVYIGNYHKWYKRNGQPPPSPPSAARTSK
jgi:hypothetical protein